MSRPSTTDSTDAFNAVGAWFLGPRGENLSSLTTLISLALSYHVEGRESYFPNDPAAITARMKTSTEFQGKSKVWLIVPRIFINHLTTNSENIEKLFVFVHGVSPVLYKYSVPFWSPRYNAHMNMDTSMPGIVAYFTTMLGKYLCKC